ncbi:MAG: AAA family ATPase [Clostridia bacterium]|nr:AAA family ATPase [Clostridia bacterium]
MLKKFIVTNFKNFKTRTELDLSKPLHFEFNEHLIKDNCIKTGVFYGINGSGKSNLGLAIFDIVIHLTDNEKMLDKYLYYLNLSSNKPTADFEYYFSFSGHELIYKYSKKDAQTLTNEIVIIDGNEVINYNYDSNNGYVSLEGAESLKLKTDSNISRVKYIMNSSLLVDNEQNKVFNDFSYFVNHMLLFYSLQQNRYQGLVSGIEDITQGIIKKNKVKEFEIFLKQQDINYDLDVVDNLGQKILVVKFGNKMGEFSRIASTGTMSMTLFYYWYIRMQETSFVFMDEFDAFYHFELSQDILKTVSLLKAQVLLTTHNTDLLSNDILRPDCYFHIENNKINALVNLTDKELRKAHNLQKMYKAGCFSG